MPLASRASFITVTKNIVGSWGAGKRTTESRPIQISPNTRPSFANGRRSKPTPSSVLSATVTTSFRSRRYDVGGSIWTRAGAPTESPGVTFKRTAPSLYKSAPTPAPYHMSRSSQAQPGPSGMSSKRSSSPTRFPAIRCSPRALSESAHIRKTASGSPPKKRSQRAGSPPPTTKRSPARVPSGRIGPWAATRVWKRCSAPSRARATPAVTSFRFEPGMKSFSAFFR